MAMRALLMFLFAIAVAAPAAAQPPPRPFPHFERIPADRAPPKAARMFQDVLKDGWYQVYRNSRQSEPPGAPNRALYLTTHTRSGEMPGVCEADVLALVATPEAERGETPYGPTAGVVRYLSVDHLYTVAAVLPGPGGFASPEREKLCASLEQPHGSGLGWFTAPGPGAAWLAGQLVRQLADDLAKGPRHGLLSVCARATCPDAAAAPQLFRPEVIASVERIEACPEGQFCFRLDLTTFATPRPQGLKLEFATRSMTRVDIASLSMDAGRLPLLEH